MEWLISTALAAQAVEVRTPLSYSWLTYAWVIGLSGAGGVVSFSRKVRAGDARVFNFAEFIGEIFTSGFVGIITFWLCEWANVSPMLSAVFIAITGHMGSRALFVGEKIAQAALEKHTGLKASDIQENK